MKSQAVIYNQASDTFSGADGEGEKVGRESGFQADDPGTGRTGGNGQQAEDRKIFVQRYWYMYSVKEIAGNLGLGESKVKMTLLRQREKLKKVLEEEGIPV